MQIQILAPGEETRLRRIRLRALLDAPDAFVTTYEESAKRSLENWREQLATLPTFVAVDADTDVGMVRGAPDHKSPTSAWLISLRVAKECRGQGAGDALVDAVVDWARGQNFLELQLDVANDNLPAIALYSRHGFAPTGDSSTLPPPRQHVQEHRRLLRLSP